ncbi:MAG TPA: DNA polymerase III subunit [Chloroflexota bacterium]
MWQIIGHQKAVETLAGAVADNRLPHAVLITGPAEIGKTTLALELAKTLNCVGADPPCGRCVHCRQISAGGHPDVSIVERPDGKDSILIGQVRTLRDAAALRPYQGRTKVYIIAGAEALTLQAADALLKTLEEPQPQVQIILTAVQADVLPATVVSRCRVMPLQPVEGQTLTAALVARGADEEEAERLARLARGSAGWALRALKQPKLAAQRSTMLERLCAMPDMGLDERLQLAESLTSDRKDRSAVRHHIELLLLLARDLLFVKGGLPPVAALDEQRDTLTRQAQRYDMREISAHLQAVRNAMIRIDANVDPRLVLEAAFVAVP